MGKITGIALVLATVVIAASAGALGDASAQAVRTLTVVSDRTVGGFAFPESVAWDPQARVLYVSEFGSELKPAEKDGRGRISTVSLDGIVLERSFLPPAGGVLHKPKGLWVEGRRLWVTDIDAVWIFDLATRRGRKVELPAVQFANDVAVKGGVLYVSDNRSDRLVRVEPADFLDREPRVTTVLAGRGVNPNGLYPARDGSLLMVGFKSAEEPRGIAALDAGGELRVLARDLGRLDGIWELDDGTLLVTDWASAALARWSPDGGLRPLATGFKGPADFTVVPEPDGLLVVVPDLVKSELRFVRLRR